MSWQGLRGKRAGARVFFVLVVCALFLVSGGPVQAARQAARSAPNILAQAKETARLRLTVGKSIIVNSGMPVKRVSVAAPEVADFVLLSPKQVYVAGKSPGITNLTLWGENDEVASVFDLEVAPDVSRLKEKLHEILPGERDIRLSATNDSITLSGTVSSTAAINQVMTLAEVYAPKKVVNLLSVSGVQQVMLEVRVAEMSRSLLNRLGVNLNYMRGGDFFFTQLNNLTQFNEQKLLDTQLLSSAVNAFFRFHSGTATWTAFIDALKEDGLVSILAEPNLICLSGQSANFLAGGEVPIPVPNGDGTIGIEYKTYGVGLSFLPTVLGGAKISLKVFPEISQLDFTNAITSSGFVIPAFTTRRAQTVIELYDGQSFAIAGILSQEIREQVDKFPILGDIPILGVLFRSSAYKKNETELIIVVTPHLVKPLDRTKIVLPNDKFVEPSDTEFFLHGMIEGKRKPVSPSIPAVEATFDGQFGHALPGPNADK